MSFRATSVLNCGTKLDCHGFIRGSKCHLTRTLFATSASSQIKRSVKRKLYPFNILPILDGYNFLLQVLVGRLSPLPSTFSRIAWLEAGQLEAFVCDGQKHFLYNNGGLTEDNREPVRTAFFVLKLFDAYLGSAKVKNELILSKESIR